MRRLARTLLVATSLAVAASAQTWTETAKPSAPLGAPGDNFGWSVSLSGQVLAVGAPREGLGWPISFCEGLAFEPQTGALLASEVTSKQLTRFDLATGIAAPLGTLPAGLEGLALDSTAGIAYMVQSGSALYAIDLASWTVAQVGPLAHPLLTSVRGLAFDPASGVLYGVDAVSDVLAVIDTTSGAGLVVGGLGSAGLVTGLAWDPLAGWLFGSTESTAELVRIDPLTGASAPVGPLGHPAVGALAFDPALGQLYGWNSPGSSQFYTGLLTIDTSTGAGTPLQLPGILGAQGATYVLDLASGTTSELRASDAEPGDLFGYDAALDGDTLAVGAYLNDDQGSGSGSAYVFERDAFGTWTETIKLLPTNGFKGDAFGLALDLSGDTVVVGAPGKDGPRYRNQGSVYVFERSAGWAQTQVLRSPEPALRGFGTPALEGNRLVVGQPHMEGNSGMGRAYVFERASPSASFALVAILQPADPEPGNLFGNSVALSGDCVAVGASAVDCPLGVNCGAVYIFERDAGGPGAWGQVAKLEEPTAGNYDQLGHDLALEGDTLLVEYSGADLAGSGSGAVVHFERSAGTWSHVGLIVASDQEAGDRFGSSVGLSGNTFAAGAYRGDGYVETSGAAYLFDR